MDWHIGEFNHFWITGLQDLEQILGLIQYVFIYDCLLAVFKKLKFDSLI